MRNILVRLFGVSLLAVAVIAANGCEKLSPVAPTLTLRVYASATASANVFVRCENSTTVTVNVTGFGEAYAATYEEAKKIADQKAQADLETAKAKAQANVTVVCGSTPVPTPIPVPTPSPTPVPVPTPPTPPAPPIPPPVVCIYAVDTTPLTMGHSGENGSVSIGTQDGCKWSASVDATWLEASPLTGVGNNSKVGLYGGPNPGPQRTATLTIRDQNGVTYRKIVTQTGRP